MPQMNPMNWTLLFFLFSAFLLVVGLKFHFMSVHVKASEVQPLELKDGSFILKV